MNTATIGTNRLIRYPVVVAHIPAVKKGKKAEELAHNQQAAIDSWLNTSSKVILLNRAEDVAHLNTKGVILDERYSNSGSMPAPTALDLLAALYTDCPMDGFGVIVAGCTILEPEGCKRLNRVRVDAQLSKAWACVSVNGVLSGSTILGDGVSAFWISRHVAKYIRDTGRNAPFASEQVELVNWLGAELTAKVLGHRYFDASHHSLAFTLGSAAPDHKVKIPFTKH